MRRTAPLKRYTRVRPRRERPRTHKFSIRLTGAAMTRLRLERWVKDNKRCVNCGILTHWNPRFDGDPDAFDLAHVQSRGAGGSDTLENTRTKCHACHMREHQHGGC